MTFKRTKNIAAILLLICLVLPLSRCSKKIVEIDENGNVLESDLVDIEYNYLIPVNMVHISEPFSFISLLPFTWPIPLWLLKNKSRKKWYLKILSIIELNFLGFSIYLVGVWTFQFGSPYWGGLLATASLIVLLIVFLLELLVDIRDKIKMI